MEELFPVSDNIVVLPREAESVSPGGIALPDSVRDKEKPTRGTVVSVGPGKTRVDGSGVTPVRINPGSDIFHGRYAGFEVEVQGTSYRIIREEDVLAVVVDVVEGPAGE